MIKIDEGRCVGCGRCADDCFPNDIEMRGGHAVPRGVNCIECGHCVAVCPADAVELVGYDMSEARPCGGAASAIAPEVYLDHLRARRTIRHFKSTPVSDDQLRMILDAGRWSPTGGNLQNVSYFVSREPSRLRGLVMDELKAMGDEAASSGKKVSWYSDLWVDMYDEYTRTGRDRLYFGASTVIAVSSDSPQSAMIAAAHIETMVYCLGLGMLYSGFTVRAAAHSPALRDYMRLREGRDVYAVLVIGEPDVEFVRTVPRRPADVVYE